MPKKISPRKGSLQYWPRKRIRKFIPSVNWSVVSEKNSDVKGLLGFIGYKVGMISVAVKDNTEHSKTKGKRIILPATILECPTIKIFSIRFYKNNKVITEILNPNIDKELKKKVKIPKNYNKKIEDVKDYDKIHLIIYTQVKKTNIKKKPDLAEIALGGNKEEQLNFTKENLNKELEVRDFFKENDLIDVRGLTRGKGNQGVIKRFGVSLRVKKSEKGQRKVGSIAPWHPAYVTFRTPMAGQLGLFTRVENNKKVLAIKNIDNEFKHFGKTKNNCVIVTGSIQGAKKRQILFTKAFRKSKKQSKKTYEFIKIE